MNDDVKRDRDNDGAIDTELDLGSLDDIVLDDPIDGDTGVEKGKGRKPSHSTKKTASDFIKGAAGGVASGVKDAIYREIPDARVIASGVSDALNDIQALRDDLSKQLAPLGTALENAGRKLLPRVEKVLPKTTYQKIMKKLDERAENRKANQYTQKSQAEIDAETVRSELTALFGAQAETQLQEARVNERNVLIDRTLGSFRHKQTTLQLVHLYDSVRSTELFHKTQHLAYMKKSLELKYKHVFIARDTYNLLRQSLSVHEGYMKAIVDNTALPDMMKQKAGDYIYGSRTKTYGTMMSSALGNLRGKIFDHLKQVKDNITSTIGIATDGLNMYNDMSDMAGMMGPAPSGARLLGKGMGYLGGYFGLGDFMKRHAPTVGAINTRIGGVKASMATKLSDWKRRADASTNPLMNMLGMLMPDAFSQQTAASNDLVKSPDKAVAFDVITRQSITEIIPGYLGKIWHEIAMMRTGDESLEERVYNVYERRFTGVGAVRKSIDFQAMGSEEIRRQAMSQMVGTLRAGSRRNLGEEESLKDYEKDINQVFVNYAVNTVPFRPSALIDFVNGGVMTPDIAKIIDGLEHDPKDVLSKIVHAIYNGREVDSKMVNAIDAIINDKYRRSDAYKAVLARNREMYGYSDLMAGKMSGDEARALYKLSRSSVSRERDVSRAKTPEERAQLERENEAIRKKNAEIYAARDRLSKEGGMFVSSLSGAAQMNVGTIARKQGDLSSYALDEYTVGSAKDRTFNNLAEYDAFVNKAKAAGKSVKDTAARGFGKLASLFGVATAKPKKILGGIAGSAIDKAGALGKDFADKTGIVDRASAVGGYLKNNITKTHLEAKKKRDEEAKKREAAELASYGEGSFSLPMPTTISRPVGGIQAVIGGTTTIPPVTSNVVTEEPKTEVTTPWSETLNSILTEMVDWRKDVSSEHGTIFDAVAQIDETIRGLKLSNGATEYVASAAAPAAKREGKFKAGAKAAARGLGAGIKNVGKAYTRIYGAALRGAGTAISGIAGAASNMFNKVSSAAKGVAKWATHKEDYVDVYVKGKEGGMPLVSARKQRDPDEGIFFKATGKRVMKSADIDQVCVDKSGNIVISEEDLKAGLVMNNSTPIGKLGAGMLSLGKSYFSVYGKALTAIGGVAKTALKVLFGAKERYVDVYRKNEILKGPLITARKQREEGVYFFESGKRVDKTSDIHEPICDAEKKILISKEDIEHGLVDVNNKPLGTGGGGIMGALAPVLGKLGGIAGAGAKSAVGIYGTAYKGLMELGIGGLKGAGKFISRALGLDFSRGGEGIGDGEQTISILQKMQQDLALIADQYRDKKSSLDKDGDGDIDGSYADQMQKKQAAAKDNKFDAANMHVDVDWSKKEEEKGSEGGGEDDGFSIGDLINKVPGKWGRKLRKWTNGKALKKVMGRKAATLGRGLVSAGRTAGGFLGRHAVSLGARALPMLGSAGSAIGGALGTAGSAIGGLAGSAGTALSGMLGGGGLAGLGSALASAAGPAALAALAGYGIYRGVKGFGKENALKNVGESAGISRTNQLTFEDRMASALGMNTKFGAKMMKGAMSINPLVGLIKGIRGNDNPLTDKEIQQCRAKLVRKIKKGLPGYDRILQEFDKAIEAGNWMRARQLSGKEADGVIASLWKHSITGKLVTGSLHLLFGNDNKEMTREEIDKVHAKYNSIIKRGGPAAKSAQRLLDKFDDYVTEGDWKRAREIAGSQFQSKGLVGATLSGIKSFFVADKDKPMSESEVKQARTRLQKLASGGNKTAQKILDQFDEAVTEMNWKKARKLVGEESMSGLRTFAKSSTLKWINRIGTLGLSTFFEHDEDTPMTESEIKKFTDKMNYMISKNHDKTAQRKLDRFEELVVRQDWAKARKLANEPYKGVMRRAAAAVFNWAIGSDEKEMTEPEISKFRASMERKLKIGGATAKYAQRKLDAFEDAVGMQNWRKARMIANSPNDGLLTRAAKSIGRGAANSFRFFFGGDGQPMSSAEIEQARKEMGWAISEGKSGAQKRLDMFDDYVADEKWNKARRLAKMPYKNIVSRVVSSVGDFLFGNDKDALTPQEIEKYRGEMEQKIADAPDGQKGKLKKLLSSFNDAVERENWPKARKISKIKAEGAVDKAMKAINPFNWFKDTYEDCMEMRQQIDEKITDSDDPSGLLNKGLDAFDLMVRRQQYGDAMDLGKDILNLKPHELATKHGFDSEAYNKLSAQANELMEKIGKAQEETNGFLHPIREMQLSGLMRSIRNGSDKWDTDFFEETAERLSEIMGTPEYTPKHQRPDDAVFKRGEELLKTIDELNEKRSWVGSPIIKSRLGSLANEVKSDPSLWDNETIDEWYDRLGEIDEDYKDGRKGATDESAALEKRGNDLLKHIRAAQEKFSWFRHPSIRRDLANLENEVAGSKSDWNDGSFAEWEDRLKDIDKDYNPNRESKEPEESEPSEEMAAPVHDAIDKDLLSLNEDLNRQLTQEQAKSSTVNQLPAEAFADLSNAFAKGGYKKFGIGGFFGNMLSGDGRNTNQAMKKLLIDHVKRIGLDKYAQSPNGIRSFMEQYPLSEKDIPAGMDPYMNGDTIEAVDHELYKMLGNKGFSGLSRMWDRAQVASMTADSPEEFADGGYKSLLKATPYYKGYKMFRDRFVSKPTASEDAAGTPTLVGEAGTEAILPLQNRPGNLLSRLGTKLGMLMRGRDIGPTAPSAAEASVHATDAKSEPLTNYLAKNLFNTAGGVASRLKSGLVGLPSRLGKIGAAAQALLSKNPFQEVGGILSDGKTTAMSKIKDLLYGKQQMMADHVVPEVKPEVTQAAQEPTPATGSQAVKLEGSDQIVRVNQEVAEQIKTLSKNTEELHKLIGLILSKEGIKVQGIDLLTQVVATTGSAPRAEGGNTTIIQMVPQESGIDLRKRQM